MTEQDLEDLLALITEPSITFAARRRNVTQPAFSRRLQAIERKVGVELVDRSVRPSKPTLSLRLIQQDIESSLVNLKKLSESLTRSSTYDRHISIVATHSLASSLLPLALNAIKHLTSGASIRLRSANSDVCFQMLLAEEVSLMLAYETKRQPMDGPYDLIEKITVAKDALVPVCAPAYKDQLMSMCTSGDVIPLLTYPRENYLGKVLYNEVMPSFRYRFAEAVTAGFTNTLITCVKQQLGMSWLPLAAVRAEINRNELLLLENDIFIAAEMDISMLILKMQKMQMLKPLRDALAEAICKLT